MSEPVCSGYYTGYDLEEGGSTYRRPCGHRCGCALAGCPFLSPPPVPPKLHVLSQVGEDGKPLCWVRTGCNYCCRILTGPEAPQHVDNWADWRAAPNNCQKLEHA